MTRKKAPTDRFALAEWIGQHNMDAMMADGFEDAILGVGERCGQPALVVYDVEKCVQILITRDGMTEDEAMEWLYFNSIGAWVGEMTPVWLTRRPP